MEIATLTTIETERLSALETTIEQGLQTFVEVGNALMEIRDSRLYRATFGTFEEYCRERWGVSKPYATQMIQAAKTVGNLVAIATVLPTNEAQVRPLTKLSSEQQLTVWPLVVDTAPNGKITAAHVQKTVDEYTQLQREERAQDAHLNAALADESKPICGSCGQVYDGPRCPDCFPPNYKRDNRRSTPSDIYVPQGNDACQTPAYAIDPLLPYLSPDWLIWEPAQGEGYLVEAFYDASKQVTGSDILDGHNFFEYEPDAWDCIVTNPPFSITQQWLKRCYELGKPFALLIKVEALGTKGVQELIQEYGFEMMLLDKRVDFKMPFLGWGDEERKSSAQFPTFWLCWQLLPEKVTFGKIDKRGFNGSSD